MSAAELPPPAAHGFWTLEQVARALSDVATGHAPAGPRAVRAIATDTRTLKPGDVFVALAGERYDAHDHLADAVAAGAAALVVADARRAGGLGAPVYEVHDTRLALGRLARHWRRAWGQGGRLVVGVVGSNGKTSTKELLRAALGAARRVHATPANLNNLVGVPLTLLGTPPDAEVAVVEMGTNAPGEIAALRAVAEPDVVVLTSIGEEHLEGLGDLAGVLREESDAFDGAALAITPADQPEVAAAARGRARTVLSAGLDAGDVRPARRWLDADGSGGVLLDGVEVRTPLRGAHNLRNLMLALAACRAVGVPIDDAARGLAAMPVPGMRAAWQPLGAAALINDAYNANPPSTRAAIDLVAGAGGGRQRVAVLGTMRELGAHADRLHDEVARRALDAGIDIVAGVGEMGDALRRVAPGDPRVVTAPDPDALWPLLAPRLAPDAVVLLKGSRGVRLERLVPHLEAWAGVAAAPAAPPATPHA